MKLLFLLSFLLIPLKALAQSALTAEQQLEEALLCQRDSLETVRSLVAKRTFTENLAATGWGDELDEKNVVIVHHGLKIHNSITHAVISQFDTPYDNFNGIVFAEFEGDYQTVVMELGLSASLQDDESALGRYVLPRPARDKDELCPPTVILTPRENGRFLLGCGWCNG